MFAYRRGAPVFRCGRPTDAVTHPGAVAGASDGSPGVQRLTRWVNAGGLWEVVATSSRGVTIGLCRCDGGEEVDRFTTSDPLVLKHLAGRVRSEE